MTPEVAIRKYRKRIAIEHTIRSLKNVAGIKPLRVWDDSSVTGRMVLPLLSEAVLSMVRYDYPEDEVNVTRKGVTTVQKHRPDNKSLCRMLNQLTLTLYYGKNGTKRMVLSGVTVESIGILERMEAKTTLPRGLDRFTMTEKAVETT